MVPHLWCHTYGAGDVEVNFHSDLIRLIHETRYLDRMGFHIPEIALNVALQDDKYNVWLEGLNVMLDRFYEVRLKILVTCSSVFKNKFYVLPPHPLFQ